MKNRAFILVILLFLSINLFSQKGTLRGRITDVSTGETLLGASVTILNSNPLIGTISDFDGNFTLSNIPSGIYNLKCTFISYQTKTIENIEIQAGEVTVLDFQMSTSSETISEVVVTATAVRNSESAIQTVQRKSATLINGISSQQMSKLGDSDASSALKRISGVSVDGGKYIFVRGLSDRYSKISLNGAEIPGLDPNKNTVQMDLFPSNIIDNMIIYKTFSPDLPGSFSGGYVDIATKDFPEKFTLQFSTSVGYNPNANFRNDFLSYQGSTTDILGYDNGFRDIPQTAQTEVPWIYQDNNKLDEITSSFNNIMEVSEKQSFINHSHSFSVGNQIKVFGKQLGFNLALSYAHDYKMYNDGVYSKYNLVAESDGSSSNMDMTISQNDNKSEEETIIAGLINLTYKISNNHKIGINVLRNQGGLSTSRFKYGPKPSDDLYMYEHTLGYLERGFTSTQLKGKHVITNLNNTTIEWISSYTNSLLNEPDLRFFNYDKTGETYKISYNAYPSPTRFYRDLEELNFDNKLHITIPFDFSGNSSKFKFGGAYVYKDRISISRKFDILSQGVPFNGNITDYLNSSNIGQNATGSTYGVYVQNDPITDDYNSYNANELIASGYAMVDLALTENLRIVAGARYEYDKIFIENNLEKSHSKYVNSEHTYNRDILPALNITYSLTEEMNIRAAVSRTLARPSFREIAPYSYYDFKEGWRVVGNPDLQRTLIDNYDLRWETYLKPGELISVSAFYKKFYNAIELVDDPRSNNPEFHYINIEKSMLYGVEIELRKQIFEGLVVGGNFTYVKSEVIEPDENYQVAILTNPEYTGVRPMYGQAPWIINSFINYENDKIGLASNVGFNMSGQKLVVVTKGGTPNVYEHPSSNLNFNISKKIGEKFSLKFAIDNILDSELRRTYTYADKEYVFQSYKSGRVFSFSFNYLIN